MKTLLIVDGNSILNRAFFGIRPLTTHDGRPTNALYGFTTMLYRQITELKPDSCVIAFDLKAPTFRHKMYAEYKAGRKPMPPELGLQLEPAHRLAKTLGFCVIEKPGYEADDIIGTYAAMGDASGEYKTYIFTGDRDSLQLISDGTSVVLATNKENILFDRARFFEEYGVMPETFVDVKAIMGDSSDNIPGVAGIGEKGALKLISQFGSLENVYASYLSEGSGVTAGVASKLTDGRQSAFLSRELATICRSVPDLTELCELEGYHPDKKALYDLFADLEFSALIKKYRLDEPDESEKASKPSVDGTSIEWEEGIDALKNILSEAGTAITAADGVITAFNGKFGCRTEVCRQAFEVINSSDGWVCHDCKSLYEKAELALGHKVHRGCGFDIMLAAYIIDPQAKYEIENLSGAYLNQKNDVNMSDAEKIYYMRPSIEAQLKSCGGEKLFYDIEMPLASVLTDMELCGFLIDRDGLAEYGNELSERSDRLVEMICEEAGQQFNINSPKQLGEVLFEKLGLPGGKKTKTGYSTSIDVLQKLMPDHQIVRNIIEYRRLTKLYSTYVVGLLKVADQKGRVHTQFKQTGTATGRLSSAEPNLQNIPIRTAEGRELRKFFIADKNRVLIDADYSQIELRILAHISDDVKMREAFKNGEDIHTSTASAVFGVEKSRVTAEQRKRAKAVNFGIVYGIGDFSLADDLGISMKQAKEYIESYLLTYSDIAAYLKDIVASAKNTGYVTTLFGRRRNIPEINSQNGIQRKFGERVAMNSPIQGTAADIVKIAMLGVSRRLKKEGLDANLILQVHDELIVEASKDDCEAAARILREEMENAVTLSVPLIVELGKGERWFEM